MLNEFKAFAMRGNVLDMAVGIIIGAAFGKVVSSLVADVIMPPIGLLIGGINFSNLSITLKDAKEGAAAVTLNYGMFIQSIMDFLIITGAIYIMIKGINNLKKKEESVPVTTPQPTRQEILLTEIRDAIMNR